jgi:EAL domain-containing protein (putative c-di-GMP-specific phosphodiesterase class I)
VSPGVFVRVAESCNLTDALFRLVVRGACAEMARWTAMPGAPTSGLL